MTSPRESGMDNSDGFHVRESSGKTPDGGRFVSYTVWYTSDDAPRPQRDTNTSIPEDDTTRFDENASFDEDGRPRRKRRPLREHLPTGV